MAVATTTAYSSLLLLMGLHQQTQIAIRAVACPSHRCVLWKLAMMLLLVFVVLLPFVPQTSSFMQLPILLRQHSSSSSPYPTTTVFSSDKTTSSTSPATVSTNGVEHGSNYILMRRTNKRRSTSNESQQQREQQEQKSQSQLDRLLPPLVIIPGFAQGMATYEHHLSTFAQTRDVLLYQPIGLGKDLTGNMIGQTTPSIRDEEDERTKPAMTTLDVSLLAQAVQLMDIIDTKLIRMPSTKAAGEGLVNANDDVRDDDNNDNDVFHIAGFSMGGRIALCVACLYPHRVSKLHLTGVAFKPSSHAQIHYQIWNEMLLPSSKWPPSLSSPSPTTNDECSNVQSNHNMEGFAWSALLATYSSRFLQQQPMSRLRTWVQILCQSQTPQGLAMLLQQTHNDEEWSVSNMVQKLQTLKQQNTKIALDHVTLCVGAEDRMATVEQVQELATSLAKVLSHPIIHHDHNAEHCVPQITIVEDCGHAVPVETPKFWRQSIIETATIR